MITFWRLAEAEADGDELRSSWEGKFELCCIIANNIHNTVSTYIFFYSQEEISETEEEMIIYCFTTHNILLFSCEWISTFVSSYHLLQRNKTNSQEDPIKQKHKEVFYFPPILCHNVSELKAYYLGDKLSCISWKLSRQGPPAPVYLDISSERWRINFSRKISVDRRC